MPARRGSFGASLTPFGGGTLNLEAVYAIGDLTPTPDPPTPAPPPQAPYEIPVVGTTPVPPSAVQEPATIPSWSPSGSALDPRSGAAILQRRTGAAILRRRSS